MATYYKYKSADQGLAIDWAQVGSDLTDNILEEQKRRDDAKAKIDEDTRALDKKLQENVQGQSQRVSEFSLDFGNQASEVMLIQERLLKSGLLSVRDYTVQRQNLIDSTNEVFGVAEQFQKEFERRMERAKGSEEYGTSAELEQYLMDNFGAFVNLNQSAAVVNPEDGNVSLGLRERDANGNVTINTSPEKLRAVSSLSVNLMQDYDKYDIDPVTDKFIASTGNWDTVIRERGTRTMKGLLQKITSQTKKSYTVEELMDMQPGLTREEAQEFLDAGLNPYLEAENDLVSEVLENPYNAASILTDTKGGYKFTMDENEAANNESLIFLEDGPNGVLIPRLTDKQKEVADFTIRNNIRNKENRKVSTTVVSDVSSTSTQKQDLKKERGNRQDAAVGLLGQVWSAETEAQLNSALNSLASNNTNIKSLTRKASGELVIDYIDPDKRGGVTRKTVKVPDGMTGEQFVAAASNFILPPEDRILDVNERIAAAGEIGDKSGFRGSAAVQLEETDRQARQRLISEAIEIAPFLDGNRDVLINHLSTVVASTTPSLVVKKDRNGNIAFVKDDDVVYRITEANRKEVAESGDATNLMNELLSFLQQYNEPDIKEVVKDKKGEGGMKVFN